MIDAIVIGGGQAGLAMRAMLTRAGVDHVVLERHSVAARWRERWDSFTLLTPNWTVRLPRGEYDGPSPDGFMARDEIVRHLERYASTPGGDIVTGVEATEVSALPGGGFRISTSNGPHEARNVIVATGTFQRPKRPDTGVVSADILDLHSSSYRNPDQLPAGGVLVIGSAQSGTQIAEDLLEAGRPVYLSLGRAGRVPRRYRGRDAFRWLETIGYFEQPVEALPSPANRFLGNPHVSGKRGGKTINLHQLASAGVRLLGRLSSLDGHRAQFADDRAASLAAADDFAAGVRSEIDRVIEQQGMDAPPADPADDYQGNDGFAQPDMTELDLKAAGISTILWSAGYSHDFSWVRPATLDAWGYPVQRADYADSRGLYFLGMHFLHWRKSGLFYGVGDEAAAIAAHIGGRGQSAPT